MESAAGQQGKRQPGILQEGTEIPLSEAEHAIRVLSEEASAEFEPVASSAGANESKKDATSIPSSSSKSSPLVSRTEGNPLKSTSYILFTLQFMAVTLDIFLETTEVPPWHYSITSIQCATALYLSLYQIVRLWSIRSLGGGGGCCRCCNKATALLLASLSLQLFAVAFAGIYLDIENDNKYHWGEWALFGSSIAWGFVNPMTYSATDDLRRKHAAREDGSTGSAERKRLSPAQAAANVFTKHFFRTPLLFAFGSLFACGQAILTTFQGSVINALTRTVTRVSPDTDPASLDQELLSLSAVLVGAWAGQNACRFLFDLTSARMFSALEVWLRGAVFERAVEYAAHPDRSEGAAGAASGSKDPASEFQARYASDVVGVVALYGTLLRGVTVNILLVITNFVFLVTIDFRVALTTLGFLAMGITGGPTDLASDAASSVQKTATEGLGLVGDAIRNSPTIQTTPDLDKNLTKKHETDVLEPIRNSLFRQIFFTNSVDTFINCFSSFLTVIVVITMVFQVSDGEMNSSDFLGTFFVFRELQKPAMKISGILKAAVKRSSNLDRLNGVIFAKPSDEDDGATVDDDRSASPSDEERISINSGTILSVRGISSDAVSNLSMEFTAGQFTCLAGDQRDGVTGILTGMTKARHGELIASGRALSQAEVVATSATIFSTPYLLSGTVGWNIAASRPDAARGDISAAIERAGLADAISKLPRAQEADIGAAQDAWSDALLLRLAVARTFLRSPRPSIWVLPNFGNGGKLEKDEWRDLVVLLQNITQEESAALVISTTDSDFHILADRVLTVDEHGHSFEEV